MRPRPIDSCLPALFLLLAASSSPAASPLSSELQRHQSWVTEHFGNNSSSRTNPPFSFQLGDEPARQLLKDFAFTNNQRLLGDTRIERTLIWTSPGHTLQIRCVAIEYRHFPVSEWAVYLKNIGTSDSPVLSVLQPLDCGFGDSSARQFVLHHNRGDDCSPESYKPCEVQLEVGRPYTFAPVGGRPTHTGFPYFNLAWDQGGVIVAIGWPGQWATTFEHATNAGVRIRGGQELTYLRLHPGEEIRTPLVAVQFWQYDRLRAQNVWRRWMRIYGSPQIDGKPPGPILSSCGGGFFPGIQCTETTERQFINAFAGAGVQLDYWWLDAGWYPCNGNWPMVGTWTPETSRFPNGLKAVSDAAHAKGMGFIVWFEPERVSPGTWLYTNHPAWLLGRDGDQKLLNLGNGDARQWLIEHVDALLTNQGIDLYRQDFNIDPLPFWRANDSRDRQGITEIRHVEGYLAYWDELRRRHPRMLIDSCASGGRRNDLETLRRAVPLLRSDYQAFDGNPAYAPGNQCHTLGLAPWLPYYGQGVYYSDRLFLYSARSYFCPGFGVAVDVRKPGIDWPLIRRTTEQWRRVSKAFLGDFYPLTPWRLEPDVWLAWQFHDPETDSGFIQAFARHETPYRSARLQLHGLTPDVDYLITDEDTSTSQTAPGQELLDRGLLLAIATPPCAPLIRYQPALKLR